MPKYIIYPLTFTFTLLLLFTHSVKATNPISIEDEAPPIYHLIAGSFNSFERANVFAANMRGYGYNVEILNPLQGSSIYRVSIYKNNTQSEVQRFARYTQPRFEERLWVFEIPDMFTRGGDFPTVTPQVATPQVASPSTSSVNGVPTYYLIMGSFDTYERAWESSLALSDRGFETGILQPENPFGHFRVYVFFSQNRQETEDYAKMLKRNGKDGGSWIYASYSGVQVNPGFAERRQVGVSRSPAQGFSPTTGRYTPSSEFEVPAPQPSGIPDAYVRKGQYPYVTRSAQPLTSTFPSPNNPMAYLDQPEARQTFIPAPTPMPNPVSRGGDFNTQMATVSTYYLIANSSSSLADATRFAEEMVLKGFTPTVLRVASPKQLYRVSLYENSNRSEVEYVAAKLAAALGQKDLWIYHP